MMIPPSLIKGKEMKAISSFCIGTYCNRCKNRILVYLLYDPVQLLVHTVLNCFIAVHFTEASATKMYLYNPGHNLTQMV